MQFLRQIKNEIKVIFSSKFILIIAIIVAAFSIIVPVINALSATNDPYDNGGPIMYAEAAYDMKYGGDFYYNDGQEPITVGDVTITSANPFYWQLNDILNQQEWIQSDASMFTTPEALDLAVDLLDVELNFYAQCAASITTTQDYRYNFVMQSMYTDDGSPGSLYKAFIYSHISDESADVLYEAISYRTYIDREVFDSQYYNIPAVDRLAALDQAEERLNKILEVIKNDDFQGYIEIEIAKQNDVIANYEAQIEAEEEKLVAHPELEESVNANIEYLQKQITLIQTSTIPWLEYRGEKNIIPFSGMWQDTALNEITNAQSQLQNFYIMTKEDFERESWNITQYGSYDNYLSIMNKQKDELNNTILIATNCLDIDKPDMRYVSDGARFITMNFLSFSLAIAIFAVLLGGWLIASEFQSGTIRLLMIRPRTRTKILMSKFFAALIIALGLYVACALVNLLMNGILFGFGDLAYPNMTITGPVGFLGYYLPKLLACSVTIIFALSLSFMMSVLVKNIAVSIIVPVVCYIGSMIALTFVGFSGTAARWIAYTPIPYLQLANFFQPEAANIYGYYYGYTSLNPIGYMIDNGVPLSLPLGIGMLLVLSGLCVFFSILSFRKRDITN